MKHSFHRPYPTRQQRPFRPRRRQDKIPYMPQRHAIQNDVTMFVTTNVLNRRPIFQDPAFARMAIDYLYRLQEKQPFLLFAFVIMPDHLHLLLQVRAPHTISTLMNTYKTGLTFELGIGAFWQPRFDLRIPDNCYNVLRYIHENPMKKGLVENPKDYPWSSASGKWEVTPIA